nr:ribonuclease H-like domain-containing protein [Sedimentibacter sp.]
MIVKCTEIENIETKNKYINKLFRESFFFDIETTGLSRLYSDIISITVLFMENNTYKIYQLYCEYKIDEKEVIKLLEELIKSKKYIITYNGNSFDIPFIMNKCRKYELSFDLDSFIKIDLYRDIKNIHNKIDTDNLKLKTVEEFFKIKRNDTITGQDVLILYEAYCIEPRKEFSEIILQHNYEDVYNLPILFKKVFNLYDKVISYNNLILKINFSDFSFKKNTLTGFYHIVTCLEKNYIHKSLNFDLELDIISQLLKINIPIKFYTDQKIKEFYYLNNDDYNILNYTTIEGIKRNLIPLKFNDQVYNENIVSVMEGIMNLIFK